MAGCEIARRAAAGLLLLVAACSSPTPSSQPSTGGVATGATVHAGPNLQRQWPDEASTGVPAGTELSAWTDDCTITRRGTRIDARLVECDLRIRTTGVVITRSRILGSVAVRQPEDGSSFTISDSEVVAGERMITVIGNGNFTVRRSEVTGGRRSIYCEFDCTIENSWVHGQASDPDEAAHLSGIRMGRNTTLRSNTIVCEGERIPPASGCSAALTGYGDFAPIENNLVEGNLFQSGTASFCAFGGSTRDKPFSDDAHDIRFVQNIFERGTSGTCGILGAIEAFDVGAPGNVWENNFYDDGEPVPPRN